MDTQAPHRGGPPACKDKRMLCFLIPRQTGVHRPHSALPRCPSALPRTDGGTPHGPAARCAHTGPPDTQPPGAMRNTARIRNADSGDCYEWVEHPPAASERRAGLNQGKRAPARWRSTVPRRRPDTRPRQGRLLHAGP